MQKMRLLQAARSEADEKEYGQAHGLPKAVFTANRGRAGLHVF